MPQWTQTTNGNDAWAAISFALRAYVAPTLRLSIELGRERRGTALLAKSSTQHVRVGRQSVRRRHDGVTRRLRSSNRAPAATERSTAPTSTSRLPTTRRSTSRTSSRWRRGSTCARRRPSCTRSCRRTRTPSSTSTRIVACTGGGTTSSGNTRSITTTNAIALNTWAHIAITYACRACSASTSTACCRATTGNFTGTLATNSDPLFIGTDLNLPARVRRLHRRGARLSPPR